MKNYQEKRWILKWPKNSFFVFITLWFLIVSFNSCQEESDSIDVPDNAFSSEKPKSVKTANSEIVLSAIPESHTGISFNNQLNDQGGLNPFVWNFIYTGGGVATGDLDNDGLPDIYFGGNQVSDQVYKNSGDFKFKNMSDQAGIADDLWTTGVFMADVNSDGLLDIYVCKTSYTISPEKNRNKLFINKGGFRFEEKAAAFGLDDPGFSTHASFFDIDQDGDLDMYLVNQRIDAFAKYLHPQNAVNDYPVSDQIFINENGFFNKAMGNFQVNTDRYGLGIAIADFDWNGHTDAFVGSDYHQADHLWLNNGLGITNQLETKIGHQSFYSMGTDVGDINNDGWADLFVLDMAFQDHKRAKTNMASMNSDRFWSIVDEGGHFQYSINTLQLNKGDGSFTEISQLAGVSKTDWSWGSLIVDLDLDGHQDILVTNGILKDMQNNDFNAYVKTVHGGQVGPQNFQEVMTQLPSNPIQNKIFKNDGELNFIDISSNGGFAKKGFSHGMAYADFNLDGKVDIVINNMNEVADVFKNESKNVGSFLTIKLDGPKLNRQGLGASVVAYFGSEIQVATMQTTRGYYSSSEPIFHFGLGENDQVDSIKVFWNKNEMSLSTNIKANQRFTVSYQKSKKMTPRFPEPKGLGIEKSESIDFTHDEVEFDDFKDQVLLPYKLSQNGPFIAEGDLNGDGAMDFFIGGAKDQPSAIFIQASNGTFKKSTQPSLLSDGQYEDMQAAIFDVDGDNDQDLFVVSGSNEIAEGDPLLIDRLYLNDGKGVFSKAENNFPKERINGQAVSTFDLEGDGDLDLFVGGRLMSGQYPLPPTSAIYKNENGVFTNVTNTVAPWFKNFNLITDVKTCDVNEDGHEDLVFVGEWMKPTMAINNGSTLTKKTIESVQSGIWWSIESGDFDRDGDVDFILGNLGKNNKYYSSKESSLKIYSGDLDNNGDHDLMLAAYKDGAYFPVRGRECTSQEVPNILEKFPTYDAFSQATINNIVPANKDQKILEKEIKQLSHVYLKNIGQLNFEGRDLPSMVQTGVIKDFEVLDANGDGHLDFAYVGNHFQTEVETPRFDGLLHGICFGDGIGSFTVKPFLFESEPAAMDLRSIVSLSTPSGKIWIIGQNNGPVLTFKNSL